MSLQDPPEGRSVGRRDFFRKLLMRGLDKVEEAGKSFQQRVESLTPPEAVPPPPYLPYVEPKRYLRPPGALPELDFASTCSRCGKCVEACPADCIVIDPDKAGGYPHIEARTSPCVICDDLSCMKVCPTGALHLVPDRTHIKMGYAITDHSRCLRGDSGHYDPDTGEVSITGEDCRICITQCPIGEAAIGMDEYHGMIEVRQGCTGCGVCERACPTEPASIWVEPNEPVIDFPLNHD